MATANYSLGAARLYFKASSSVGTLVDTIVTAVTNRTGYEAYDLGNVTAVELNPDITYLDHFVSYGGDRRKDKTVAVTKSINIPITFDEFTATNMTNFFGAANDVANNKMRVFQSSTMPVEGAAVLAFYTSVGKDFLYAMPKVCIKTESGFSIGAEDWMTMPMSLEVLHAAGYHSAGSSAASLCPFGYIDRTATSNYAPGI